MAEKVPLTIEELDKLAAKIVPLLQEKASVVSPGFGSDDPTQRFKIEWRRSQDPKNPVAGDFVFAYKGALGLPMLHPVSIRMQVAWFAKRILQVFIIGPSMSGEEHITAFDNTSAQDIVKMVRVMHEQMAARLKQRRKA